MITSMIFFPEKTFYEKPEDYGLDWEDVLLQTEDSVQLHSWYLKAKNPKAVLLFFHGNAGNISGRLYKAKGWVARGFNVFLLDYRGYGQSQGSIQVGEDIVRDAKAALAWIREKSGFRDAKTILYGESIGSYPAIRLAAENEVGGVILEAPFTSFVDLAEIHYGMIPGKDMLLKDFQFSNQEWIDQVKAPIFILHGTNDEICPYEMSSELIDKIKSPKAFFSIPNGAHNDLPMKAGEDYWDKPHEFITKQSLSSPSN